MLSQAQSSPSPTPGGTPSPTATPLPPAPSPSSVSITMLTPAEGTVYTTAQAVNITVTTGGDYQGARVLFYKNSVHFATDYSAPFGYAWNITSIDNGETDIEARVYDTEGNSTITPPRHITINIPIPAASEPLKLSGWAWASNIGWISFSSDNATANSNSKSTLAQEIGMIKFANAGGGPYGVTMATSTSQQLIGTLSGYAWSNNIGWIKFGGLSGFPNTSIVGENAQVNLTPGVSNLSGKVTGWARACSGTLHGDCSTMEPRTDGWDGWIALQGTNHISPNTFGPSGKSIGGVTLGNDPANTVTFNNFSGYAWGGSVVGWVDFMPDVNLASGFTGVTIDREIPNNVVYTSLSGSCTVVPASSRIQTSNTPVTIVPQITVTGGSGEYTYTPLSKSFTFNNSSAVNQTLTILITDNVTKNTVTVSCGTVNITIVKDDSLTLEIGAPGIGEAVKPHPSTSPLVVKLGTDVTLEWTNSLPVYDINTGEGFRCVPIIDPTTDSYFNDQWRSGHVDVTVDGSLVNIDTITTGTYEFKIDCNHPADNSLFKTKSAFLKIYSASQGEI